MAFLSGQLLALPASSGYSRVCKVLCSESRRKGKSMAVILYHNPRCSKSRQTLALLQDRGVKPQVIEYLKTPPDAATLSDILDKLSMAPRDLMRRKEAVYGELGLDNPELDRDALIQAMVENPILIERPILVVDGRKAALGRPPEQVLGIL
jgi:arsenate reductase